MTVAQEIPVERILGFKISSDGQSVVIGLANGSAEHTFSFSADLLTVLGLTALKAKTELEKKAAELNQSNKTQAFPVDKWEIRKSDDGNSLLFGFRHVSGAWIRLQAPRKIATPMRETLEVVEGRAPTSSASGSRN